MTIAATRTETPLRGFAGEVLARLGEAVTEVQLCGPRRGIARIEATRTLEVAGRMFGMDGSRLATATGIEVRDGIDVLYHWAFEPAGVVVTLKVLARRPELAIESIANVTIAANWIEREMHDLLGVNFTSHPDMRRLLLDDSWPEGVYPLRKDFDQVLDRPPLPPNQTAPDVPADPAKGGRR